MTENKTGKRYFDIAVVVPLEEELIQFMERFPMFENRSTDTVYCQVVDSGNANVSMVVVQQQGMGKTHATNATNFILNQFDVGLIICLGIAGSLSGDMGLGSVCYSGKIADVLDNNKITDVEDERTETEFSPHHHETPDRFTQAFNFARTQSGVREKYLAWQDERKKVANAKVPDEVPSPDGKSERLESPTTMSGTIVCGMVSKSQDYNNKLRKIDRAVLAVETESGGVFSQARHHGSVPAMSIRGISDYADKDKKKLEQHSKGSVRELAASNAANFLHFQISSNPYFEDALRDRRSGGQTNLPLAPQENEASILVKTLEAIEAEIDEALRKLSPEYKLQEKGYRLPMPRIRRTPESDQASSSEDPMDVREALKHKNRIVFSLPRTYPDQSLPWVIASDMLTAELDNRQVVPIVVDGNAIRGKQSTFDKIIEHPIAELHGHDGVKLVFIIENMPFPAKHRIEAILDEVEKYPGSKCVFISRGDDALVEESVFASRSAAAHYDSCSISFLEIAHFIQKNFGMTGGESEVVAKRLRDTFNQFRLDAHPTYFAGIPRETLSALLQANRRAELIQLAVDGFLTFIVAGDKADVNLGRRTRARFLRSLAVEIHLEKRIFDQAELIASTQTFADRHDFDINPLNFITGFQDQGILHFEDGRARISLPFIESYLLAVELNSQPELAERYFVIGDEFDFSAFDLYSEIGASPAIFDRVCSALEASLKELRAKNQGENILLGEDIAPTSVKSPQARERLKTRLSKAVEAVKKGSSNLQEKQALLDLQDRVREEAGRQRENQHEDEDESWIEKNAPLNRMGLAWTIGTILLGAGAEHLEAESKRRLSALLVEGAAVFIDEWSRIQSDIDFASLKEEITTDEALIDMPGPDDLEEKRRFVGGIIDIVEYNAMSDPMRRIMMFLCEQARHRVLSPSVDAAVVDGEIEDLIKTSWLVDIDPERGRKPLREAMRKLPRSTFLRSTMVSHYITRMYWSHDKESAKLILLNAAEDMLEPLNVNFDKARLKRIITSEKKA